MEQLSLRVEQLSHISVPLEASECSGTDWAQTGPVRRGSNGTAVTISSPSVGGRSDGGVKGHVGVKGRGQ